MTSRTSLTLGLLACMAVPCAAVAQNPQPAPPQVTHEPIAPPSASQPPPEKIAPGGTSQTAQGGGTLSDQLSRDRGTVTPPTVDPGISAPLPAHGQGTMPVIPPPGTPGGNQAVVPK